jgi:MSHA pilin protein MshA
MIKLPNCETHHNLVKISSAKLGGRCRGKNGFTLIELVIVIIILMILAAVALPKFISLQADARVAKMNGALASMKAAAAMAHAQLIARGFNAAQTLSQTEMANLSINKQIIIEGTTLGYVNGYPAAAQIAEIAGILGPDFWVPPITPASSSTGASQTIAADVDHDGSGSNLNCTVVYNEATIVNGLALQPVYTINANMSSCQ